MKKIFFVFLFVTTTMALNPAWAGDCIKGQIDAESVKASDFIFEGKLTKPSATNGPLDSSGPDTLKNEFEITKIWKGPENKSKITIFQSSYHGMSFSEDKTYLIFANKTNDENVYSTSDCGPSTSITYTLPPEIEELKELLK